MEIKEEKTKIDLVIETELEILSWLGCYTVAQVDTVSRIDVGSS